LVLLGFPNFALAVSFFILFVDLTQRPKIFDQLLQRLDRSFPGAHVVQDLPTGLAVETAVHFEIDEEHLKLFLDLRFLYLLKRFD